MYLVFYYTVMYVHSSEVQLLLFFFNIGVDESFGRQDFAKELGHAMAGIPESFEHDLGFGDDAMKMGLDPLDTDSLQMLSDPCSMVTDPATEDSFRLDDTFQQPTSTAPL